MDCVFLQIAAALQAEKLILMTDVPGVMRDKDVPSSLFRSLDIRSCKELVGEGVIYGGMTPKVRGLHAIEWLWYMKCISMTIINVCHCRLPFSTGDVLTKLLCGNNCEVC
jgi:acetylglutamate kinase